MSPAPTTTVSNATSLCVAKAMASSLALNNRSTFKPAPSARRFGSGRCGYTEFVDTNRVWTAAELGALSPTERAELFDAQVVTDLSQVDPEFLARVRRKARVLLEARGLLEPESA